MAEKPAKSHRSFLILLLVLVPVLFLIGWSQASLNLSFIHPHSATGTFLLDAVSAFVWVLFVVFALILGRILLKLYAERRQNQLGYRFKTKMVVAFLSVSLIPVCFLFLFSYGLINRSIDKWFGIPFDTVRRDASAITGQLAQESRRTALDNAQHLAALSRLQELLARGDSSALARLLRRAAAGMNLDAVLCLDSRGRLAARGGDAWPGAAEVIKGFPALSGPHFPPEGMSAGVRAGKFDFFMAAQRVVGADGAELGTVIAVRRLPLNIQNMATQIQQEARRYDELSHEKKALKRLYLSILLFITLLILFAAAWLAMFFSKQVTVPVQALAEATHAVLQGNLAWRITARADAELGSLIGLFNEMTRQLQDGRAAVERATGDLQRANREMEERNNTIEAILENVPAGVISFNTRQEITQANPAAGRMFTGVDVRKARRLSGLFAPDDAREVARLFPRAQRQGVVNRQMTLGIAGRRVFVGITLSSVSAQHGEVGFVMVIEDLTDVMQAQRSAAWREVAQRIAHEIKNPLTPIRLSSDRILRLAGRPAAEGADAHLIAAVTESASLIGREVTSLETLVDEFSRFARFPTSNPVPCDINGIIENALGVFNGRLSKISVHRDLEGGLPAVRIDPEQMKRAVVNLIDNAAEALEGAAVQEIWIRSRLDRNRELVSLMVADSGPGIPPEARERLFLPYFSTKQRGTGLGLAIVSRIVSEHHGSIRVEENQPAGTQFIIELPLDLAGVASEKS